MQLAICHYSLHRTFVEKEWTLTDLVSYVEDSGAAGIDFHIRFLGAAESAAERIQEAMARSALALTGLSLSTNFNQDDAAEYRAQLDTAAEWLEVAGAIGAPVSRVFGGHLKDRSNPDAVQVGMKRVVDALTELAPIAAEHRVVLALENHGGLPCSGEEQAAVIEAVASPNCRATLDVGNYMQYPQTPEKGIRAAVRHCAYVHAKDFRRRPDGSLEATTIGQGDVDLPACLRLIKAAGYDGFVALEYEGPDDELVGVPESLAYITQVLAGLD